MLVTYLFALSHTTHIVSSLNLIAPFPSRFPHTASDIQSSSRTQESFTVDVSDSCAEDEKYEGNSGRMGKGAMDSLGDKLTQPR